MLIGNSATEMPGAYSAPDIPLTGGLTEPPTRSCPDFVAMLYFVYSFYMRESLLGRGAALFLCPSGQFSPDIGRVEIPAINRITIRLRSNNISGRKSDIIS